MRKSIILVLFSLLLISLIPAVSAEIYRVNQTDTVFQGEYADISGVTSWTNQLAYFGGGDYIGNPTKIIDTSKNRYQFYIDPAIFEVGKYYKWDGTPEPNSSSLAFVVKTGVRDWGISTIVTRKVTPVPTIDPEDLVHVVPKDTHILIARGDTGLLEFTPDRSISGGGQADAYLWLFGTGQSLDKLLGEKMTYSLNGTTTQFLFLPNLTETLDVGWYTGYIQYVGLNRKPDVFYVEDTVHYTKILDTPFDDDVIPDVDINGFVPYKIQQELEKLEANKAYSDDILVPLTIEIQDPRIIIKDYWEEADRIVIQGETNLWNGTEITVKLDPDNHVLAQDARLHTWKAYAVKGDLTSTITDLGSKYVTTNGQPVYIGTSVQRRFSIRIPVAWGEMAIGEHQLKASANPYKINVEGYKTFQVTGVWVNPTPTQIFQKVIVDEYGTHLVSSNGTIIYDSSGGVITPAPTGSWTIDVNGNPVYITVTPAITAAPTPTPLPTPTPTFYPTLVRTITPTPVPKPQQQDMTLPIIVAFIGVGGIIAYVWLFKG